MDGLSGMSLPVSRAANVPFSPQQRRNNLSADNGEERILTLSWQVLKHAIEM